MNELKDISPVYRLIAYRLVTVLSNEGDVRGQQEQALESGYVRDEDLENFASKQGIELSHLKELVSGQRDEVMGKNGLIFRSFGYTAQRAKQRNLSQERFLSEDQPFIRQQTQRNENLGKVNWLGPVERIN